MFKPNDIVMKFKKIEHCGIGTELNKVVVVKEVLATHGEEDPVCGHLMGDKCHPLHIHFTNYQKCSVAIMTNLDMWECACCFDKIDPHNAKKNKKTYTVKEKESVR